MSHKGALALGLLIAVHGTIAGAGAAEAGRIQVIGQPGARLQVERPRPPAPDRAQLAGEPALRPATALELELADWRASNALGDGGGGNVLDLVAIQTRYSDPIQGNEVLLVWTEETPNPDGVQVLINGTLIGTATGLSADQLPATNIVFITNVPVGDYIFRTQAEGTFAEAALEVVDTQPFADAANLACAAAGRDAEGNCNLRLTWEMAGTPPLFFVILLDGVAVTEVAGTTTELTLLGVPPGPHEAVLLGFLENSTGVYRGSFVATTCDLQCPEEGCDPPFNLFLCQTGYGPGPTDGALRVEWRNGEVEYAAGLSVQQDGGEVGTVPGTTNGIFLSQVPPGERTIGIQGDCGDPDGKSEVATRTFNLLTESPHRNPVSGDVVCRFNEATAEMEVTWTAADPSLLIGVFLDTPEGLVLVGFTPGDAVGVSVTAATPETVVALQFYIEVDGACYGSDVIGCVPAAPAKRYVQGVCNGLGASPQITSAIFGLAFLFTGGPAPPCRKACDGNGDGRFDLSDMVYVLSYLFLGGPAPNQWLDADQDGSPEPTCVAPAAGDDCETGHEACAG